MNRGKIAEQGTHEEELIKLQCLLLVNMQSLVTLNFFLHSFKTDVSLVHRNSTFILLSAARNWPPNTQPTGKCICIKSEYCTLVVARSWKMMGSFSIENVGGKLGYSRFQGKTAEKRRNLFCTTTSMN
jgi:hypothetical protein